MGIGMRNLSNPTSIQMMLILSFLWPLVIRRWTMKSCGTTLRMGSIVSRVGTTEASNMKGIESYWNHIWKLRVPQKVKHFLWRVSHSWLPANRKLLLIPATIGVVISIMKELFTLFGDVKRSSQSGKEAIFGKSLNKLELRTLGSLWKATSHCLQSCLGNVGMKGMLGCTTGFCMPACGVVDWCILVDVDLQDQYTIQGKTKEKSRWSPPQVGVWKVNVDAGVYNMNGSCSSGVVIRDHSGQVLCSSSGFSSRPLSALPAESVAVISGLKLALAAGVKKNQVASDCLNAINLINNPSRSISDVDNLLEEITGLSCNFDLVEFRFELRDANLLAHSLAKLALKSKTSASWNRGVPLIV
ncbi:hypothetical protein G4B88_013785 [Cannabis sativa]|uniref:RNase H type-1 domain-containing protein n=1 Tax=Cannabis sativa TaxID=3483 RepID=A0A7J6I094_CANSA|nr:hypothetical protein G4B88_013785 [Cannabis sativa]